MSDYIGIEYHGPSCTHIDALCHVWDDAGMWNGRNPVHEIHSTGSGWASIEHWAEGIVTRGVVIDVPGFRQQPFVTNDCPVTGRELEAITRQQQIDLAPGDAIIVYCGRDEQENSSTPWGTELLPDGSRRSPGLDSSCLGFIRDHDVAVVAWDMQDQRPHEHDVAWTLHGAIFSYGVAVVDHCELRPLVDVCRAEHRFEFAFVIAPLVIVGGSGSPVNPIAIL